MAFKGVKKTIEHEKAFDYYYGLEGERSYAKVAEKFGKSKTTIWNWGKVFNWQEEVKKRDAVNAKVIMQKTDDIVTDQKAEYRKEIKTHLNILRSSVNDIIKKVKAKTNPLPVTDIESYYKMIQAYKTLVQLDMQLLGEPTEVLEHRTPRTLVEFMDLQISIKNE